MNEASLSVKIEKMFAGKDHVGAVKHLEGIDINSFLTSPRLKRQEFPSIDSELHIAYEGQSRGSENPSHLN
jgi:hypothetical protein